MSVRKIKVKSGRYEAWMEVSEEEYQRYFRPWWQQKKQEQRNREEMEKHGYSILVICQELFEKDFDVFPGKRVTLIDLRYVLCKTECQFDPILYSESSFSPVYSWFLTSNPKTSRTNLRDVSASALLC